jgi:hypothetical protein
MTKSLFICFFIFLTVNSSFGQKLNIDFCNDIKNSESRKSCVKSFFDNLLVKELEDYHNQINFRAGHPIQLSFKIDISRIGVLALKDFESKENSLYALINKITNEIKPLGVYIDENNDILDSNFDYNLKLIKQEDNSILIKENEVLLAIINQDNKAKKTTKERRKKTKKKRNLKVKSKNSEASSDTIIEEVPIFPGCEFYSNNEAKKNCMSKLLNVFVVSNFNTSIADSLDIPDDVARINIQFRINKTGYIDWIDASTTHIELEKEAIRVLYLLPRMTPGKQKGKEVNVQYSLPLIFKL